MSLVITSSNTFLLLLRYSCRIVTVFMASFLCVSFTYGGDFFTMLKKERVCPFSGFEGQLLFKGEPAAGAKITRSYELFKEKGEETVIADDQGRFAFDSIFIPFRAPFLAPVEFLSHQDIFVDYRGDKIQVWGGAKRTPMEFSEFNGYPKSFYCEILENVRRVDIDKGFVVTNCHWEI